MKICIQCAEKIRNLSTEEDAPLCRLQPSAEFRARISVS